MRFLPRPPADPEAHPRNVRNYARRYPTCHNQGLKRSGWGNEQGPLVCPPNGLEVNPRGQGPRGYGSAARRMPAFEARDAGGVTPCTLR